MKELEKEYQEFSIQNDFIKTLDDFYTFMEVSIDDLQEAEFDCYDELQENKRWQFGAKIRNFLFFFFEQEEVEFYDDDNALLEKELSLMGDYLQFLKKVVDVSCEDNFRELLKLVDFSVKCYDEQLDYYEYERDRVEALLKGINMFSFKYENNRDVFEEFFKQKLDSLSKKNHQYIKER